MTSSHYIDIMVREATINRELHARLVMAAHYRIMAGDELAIAWPDWKNTPGEFGLLFRVFGDPDTMARYGQTIQGLVDAGLVRAFPVLPVPATDKRVCFVRDRKMDKFSPSCINRLNRRAAERGESRAIIGDVRPARQPHYLRMQSQSSEQQFALYVSRSSVARGGGKQYGLGVSLPDF